MRNSDPFDFFQKHSDTIYRWSAILGAALVVFLILRFFAMRLGGWRAAWRRLCREIALTAYAFSAPVRSWIRHRQSLRRLVLALGAHSTWRDAEQALLDARSAAAPAQPYAVYVADAAVTVLLAGRDVPEPSGIWDADPDDPAAWTAPRTQLPPVTPDAEGVRPIVVTLGETERGPVFVDLAIGPPTVSVEGERRSHTALFQAIAVQLDVRLPAPQAVITEGVHADYTGEPVRNAYRTAQATPPVLGIPAFLVTAALPDPLPPEMAEPPEDVPAMRVLLRGPGRGYVRTMLTDRHGRVAVPGTPVVATCRSLGAALARLVPNIPPVLPPAPAPNATAGFVGADLFQEARETDPVDVKAPVGSAPAAADLFEEAYEIGRTAEVPEHVGATAAHAALFEESGQAAPARGTTRSTEAAPVGTPAQREHREETTSVEAPEPVEELETAEEPAPFEELAVTDEPESVEEPEEAPETDPVAEVATAEAVEPVEPVETASSAGPSEDPPATELPEAPAEARVSQAPETPEDPEEARESEAPEAPEAPETAKAPEAAEDPDESSEPVEPVKAAKLVEPAEPQAPEEPAQTDPVAEPAAVGTATAATAADPDPEPPAQTWPPPPVGDPIPAPAPRPRRDFPPPTGPPVESYPPPTGAPVTTFPPPGGSRPAAPVAPAARGPESTGLEGEEESAAPGVSAAGLGPGPGPRAPRP